METTYLKINPADNVAVAISPLHAGEMIQLDGQNILLQTDVPAGHKVTLKDFKEGENVIKYGYPIGHVNRDVPQGCWICEKDIRTNLAGLLDYTYNPVTVSLDIPDEHLTFKGYRRKDGRAGVRNDAIDVRTVLVKSVLTLVRSLWILFVAMRTASVPLFHICAAAVYAIRFAE